MMTLMTTGNFTFIKNKEKSYLDSYDDAEQCVCVMCRKREVRSSQTRSVTRPCEPRHYFVLFKLR